MMTMAMENGLRIAVIGGGVAGIASSYLLQRKHEITLFEKNDYVGGHTHTIVLEREPDRGLPIDTGFIVLNDRTYPLLNRFLAQLGVPIRKTDMSFSYACRETGLEYASRNLNGFFAQRRNLLQPGFWNLLRNIFRFNRKTLQCLSEERLKGITLGQYLKQAGFHGDIVDKYLIPMSAAIWSTPDLKMMDFPAESFFRFMANHGLLSISDQPQWYHIEGGSHSYVKAFLNNFHGTVHVNREVKRIRRTEKGVILTTAENGEVPFDRVVVAAHADEAFAMLGDPSPEEIRLLSPWSYNRNRTILHTDSSLLPTNRRAWAAWNYLRERDVLSGSPITVTYHMNRLQNLSTSQDYCVTLNPARPIPSANIIREMDYSHPLYTFAALKTQAGLPDLNGYRNTFYCGSYFGNGFHEDALRSAIQVARHFGIEL